MIKNCPNCESDFKTYPSINKTCCSVKCAGMYRTKQHKEKAQKTCSVCSSVFVPKHNKSPGIYCSYQCMGVSNRKKEVKCGSYIRVFAPSHPYASKQGYVLQHRLVMESHIGRYLSVNEVVHHLNHDKKDNRVQNLQILSDSQHKSIHAKTRKRLSNGTMA